MHSNHVQGFWISLIEDTETLEGGCDGNVTDIGKLLEQPRSILVCQETGSSENDGSLSAVDQAGRFGDGSRVSRHRSGRSGGVEWGRGKVR